MRAAMSRHGDKASVGDTHDFGAGDPFDVRHGRQDCLVEAGRVAIEIDVLNSIGTADRPVVAPGFEQQVDIGVVLQVGTVDDQGEVV